MEPATFPSCKSLDPSEDVIVDLDSPISETILRFGPLHYTKQLLADNAHAISPRLCSNLAQFSIEPTYPYPELVHWSVSNFVPSTKQIISFDGERIVLSVNAQTVRKALCLPLPTPDVVQFSEESSLAIIKALTPDQLYTFMSKMLRPDASLSQHAFPYDRSLFSEPMQGVFSVLSQILGLEDDSKVTEIMVGIICLVSQASEEVNLQFDQYLADKIAYQLGHFQSGGKVFSYQTLLMLMIITENLTELRQLEPVHFSDDTDLSQRHASLSFFTFSGTVIPALYRLIFGVPMPRIGEELKAFLQNPRAPVGDWFHFGDYSLLRIYGFEGEPFRLPKFIGKRLFALEFLRQRLAAENDNFVKHKKASALKFVFTMEPFVVKSVLAANALDQILKGMGFESDKALRYDPKGIMNQRRMDAGFRGYEAEQDEVLAALANSDILEPVNSEDGSSSERERDPPEEQAVGPIGMPTPYQLEKALKRPAEDTMEVDPGTTSKKPRLQEIVDIVDDDDKSTNQEITTVVEQEGAQDGSKSVSSTDRAMTNPPVAESSQVSAMVVQKYISSEEETSKVPSKEELVKDFTDKRSKAVDENVNLMQQIRRTVPTKSTLLAVREAEGNIFRIATSDATGVSQVKLQMDQVGIPDKVNFHKQASEILYSDLLKSYLSKIKLEEKVSKLEDQIRREKAASKGWRTQAKKLESDLIGAGLSTSDKKANKKLLDEKDKLIESLQKKLKGTPAEHPQTEEIVVIQAETDSLGEEVLELKAKLLQANQQNEELMREKEQLLKQQEISNPLAITPPVDPVDLADYMSRVSLKDKEITQLVQEKNALVQEKNQWVQERSQLLQEQNRLDKSNEEKLEKISRLKNRLMGRDLLKSTQHFLWDLISGEVSKFWKDLRRLEVKKSYILAALERHKLATEQLAHLHKSPVEKAQSTITFLKYTSDDYLHNFKVDDRFQTIFMLQRVIEKSELIQKVHDKCRTLQEEVKAYYNTFKPLMDRGLPYFWDAENRLLRKDDYDNLIVARRNDHTNFEDLEGNLRGEVLVTKLGDIFELEHMIKEVVLPHSEVDEYINLEILSIQMRDLMLPTKNHFKELIKMAVRPLGLIPLTS